MQDGLALADPGEDRVGIGAELRSVEVIHALGLCHDGHLRLRGRG
jgi:hypothetical protein